MPYYIEACLLRSPYFVTFTAVQALTVKSAFVQSGRFSQVRSHILATYTVTRIPGQPKFRRQDTVGRPIGSYGITGYGH